MNSEDINAPQAVFPTGSSVTATIPLLVEDKALNLTDPAPSDPEAAPPEETASNTAGMDEPETQNTEATSMSHSSGVTIVDDAIIESNVGVSPRTPSDPSEPIVQRSIDVPQQPIATSEQAQNALAEPPRENDQSETESKAQLESVPDSQNQIPEIPRSQPLGLPPGVDLQKLLSSFANPGALSTAATTNESAVSMSADPRLPANNIATASTPTVPWQTQASAALPRQTIPSQPSDDALYEQFLVDEKRIMGNTAPHEFEPGSRLFVGNMSIETTSKRQVFLIFKKYGKLAQVSLKTTYGFVQFLTARECRAAMEGEQGLDLGGKKLHLEISKPQPARGQPAAAAAPSRRRSRSPARRSQMSQGRDSYEPYGRSPPPRRASPGRYHMPQDTHYASRRSPSPRRHMPPAEDMPLPLRYGSQIPEVQVVVLDEADRSYIYWVESSIRQAHLKVETLFLSPRLGLPAVVRQMAKEGVLAIVQCDRQLQMVNKVSLQVFDRSQGQSNVRFDEYAGLDISTAIGLLKRSQQQAIAPPRGPPQQANLAAMIAQMDPASLQQVIGALSQQQQAPYQPPSSNYPTSQYPYRR